MATVDDKKIIFSMVGLNKTIQQNNKQVLKNIYLSFFYGAKIGIIGLNGSGKSTLLKIIAGLDKSYQGEVVFSPGYSVGYLAQEPYLDPAKTVKEVVMEGVQPIVDALAEYEEINQKFGLPEYYEDQDKMDKLFTRQAELQDIIDATDAWNLDSKLERAMDALRCPPEDQSVEHLSGGERRRVALCRLLLQKPDILLLDEPTNHLDAESIDWLEQHLQQYEGTVIAVTHDRYFLDHVAGWILELDRGEGIPWKGNYSSWLEQKTKRMEQEEKTASKRRKTLERELEWVRMAPKARQAKGKARLNSYDKLLNEDVKEKEEKLEIFIPNGPRLGNKVIEAKHVAKAFGDKLLFDDLNFMLPPNGIAGIINTNTKLLLKLVDDVLQLSRMETANMSFDLRRESVHHLLETIYQTHSVLINPSLEFVTDFSDRDVFVNVDCIRLTQVITNFLNNANKFTPQGYIKLGYIYRPATNEVSIYVEDTGIGIPKEEQEMIFARFYKRSEFSQGVGLGLAICKAIAEKLGGCIEVESQVGRGSRFAVVLPCVE